MSKNTDPFGRDEDRTMMRLVLRRCVQDLETLSGDPERYRSGLRNGIVALAQARSDGELPFEGQFWTKVVARLDEFLEIKP